jgi:hypothetical protein
MYGETKLGPTNSGRSMRIYIIANDGIMLGREAPAAVNEGEFAVASNAELHAAPLSGTRLLALWNALPGVEKRKKVGDRDALIDQLWSAIEMLPEPQPDPKRPSKQDVVIAMLRQPEGARGTGSSNPARSSGESRTNPAARCQRTSGSNPLCSSGESGKIHARAWGEGGLAIVYDAIVAEILLVNPGTSAFRVARPRHDIEQRVDRPFVSRRSAVIRSTARVFCANPRSTIRDRRRSSRHWG